MELILLQLLQIFLSAALPVAIWAVLVWCITDFLAKTKKPDYSWLVLVAFHVLPLLIFVSNSVKRCSCTLDDTHSTIVLGEYRETRQVTVDTVPDDTAGSNNEEGEVSPSCMSLSNGDYENSPCEEEDDDNKNVAIDDVDNRDYEENDDNNDVVIDDSDDDHDNDDNLRNRSEEIIKKIKQQWQQEWQTEAETHPPCHSEAETHPP